MRRLICAFVVRIWHDTFSHGPAQLYVLAIPLFWWFGLALLKCTGLFMMTTRNLTPATVMMTTRHWTPRDTVTTRHAATVKIMTFCKKGSSSLVTWSLFLWFDNINPYKHTVSFLGHRQTVKTQIRRHRTRRLVRVFTVCLQKFIKKYDKNETKYTRNPLNENMDQLIRMEKSTMQKSFNAALPDSLS